MHILSVNKIVEFEFCFIIIIYKSVQIVQFSELFLLSIMLLWARLIKYVCI